ncbi:MAG: acyloxyacyl hydrolase [Parvibaculum sp.]|jgi:lipid A 3-O-deacylase|nr:acyloxyacyl hydrolase [Parvibaculum sp.]|tara:strand:- start:926 stop:1477 length:552 start_codon:yes stop_codon:yes gene_type:complete
MKKTTTLMSGLLAAALIASVASTAQANDSIIDEVRVGLLNHEISLLRSATQEDGVDVNAEVLFNEIVWLDWAGSPRPHVGATIATRDDATSFIYTGLTWDYNFWGPLFVEGSFGFALHDGQTGISKVRNELGCTWNFHESASLGYDVTEAHRVMLTFEHISNASLCSENEGLSNLGVRYGYKF